MKLVHFGAASISIVFILRAMRRSRAQAGRPSTHARSNSSNNSNNSTSKGPSNDVESIPAPADVIRGSTAEFRFLCVNDVYDLKGLGKVHTMLEGSRPENSCFCLNGDFLGGSALGVQTQGMAIIDVLNEMKLDYAAIGNHEFDYGPVGLHRCMQASRFRWFGSNIVHTHDKAILDGITDTYCFQVPLPSGQPAVVGLFGLCTTMTPRIAYPGDTISFLPLLEQARRAVDKLRAEGAEVIVALTHVSLAEDKLLAKKIEGIDVILGGHDHTPFGSMEGNTLVFKCGQDAEWLGTVDLHMTRMENGQVSMVPSWTMTSTVGVEPSPAVLEIIKKHQDGGMSQEQKQEELCRIEGGILSSLTATGRSSGDSFGWMVADAMAHYYKADLGLINGGFIRANRQYASGSVLTVGDVHEELPFPRECVLLKIIGHQLKQAMEEELSYLPAQSGAFPHVSQGWELTFSPKAPVGSRVVSLKLNGVEFDPEKTYTVALTMFMAEGGDDCVAFTKGQLVSEAAMHIKVADVVLAYLRFRRDSFSNTSPDSDSIAGYTVQPHRMPCV